jgi:hypothetical protein
MKGMVKPWEGGPGAQLELPEPIEGVPEPVA